MQEILTNMENYWLKDLLFKFSNSACILVYYGYFKDSQILMKSLWNETLDQFSQNHKAYANALWHMRKLIVYHKEFDKEFADFMLEKERYMFCTLKIQLENENSFIALTDFIEKIEFMYMLQFNKIEFDIYKVSIKAYQNLIKYFATKKLNKTLLQNTVLFNGF